MEVGDPGRWGSPPTHGQDKVGLHMKSRGAEVLFKRYRVVANSEKQTKMADGRHFVVVNASFTFIGIFILAAALQLCGLMLTYSILEGRRLWRMCLEAASQ